MTAPLCKCGCGEPAARAPKKKGGWAKYADGHRDEPKVPRPPPTSRTNEYARAYRVRRKDDRLAWEAEYREANRERLRENGKRWRERNPDARKWDHLGRFGITQTQYEALAVAQGNRCAICRAHVPGRNRELWCIDHDHETGKVRGLLCFRCNSALGLFHDELLFLEAAVRYLKEHA